MGVQNLEKVVSFGLSIGDALISANEQTTIVAKIASLIPILEDVSSLFTIDYVQLESELKGLSPEALDALALYIDKNFPAVKADSKVKVEAAIQIVIDLAKVAEQAVGLWKQS